MAFGCFRCLDYDAVLVIVKNGTLKSISWTYPCLNQTGVSPSLYFFGQHLLCAGGAWSGSYKIVLDLACLKERPRSFGAQSTSYRVVDGCLKKSFACGALSEV